MTVVATEPTTNRSAILVPPVPDDAPLPEGIDPTTLTWAWRLVKRDLRSRNGYRWPWPGNWAVAPADGRSLEADGDPCPSMTRGGLCLAKTAYGASQGGHGFATALVCAYLAADVLGEDPDKLRVRRAWVADVIDAVAWVTSLRGAYLGGAYLGDADLRDADLRDADLRDAYLGGAYLGGAYLGGADLGGARYNQGTLWPLGFDPKAAGAVLF